MGAVKSYDLPRTDKCMSIHVTSCTEWTVSLSSFLRDCFRLIGLPRGSLHDMAAQAEELAKSSSKKHRKDKREPLRISRVSS
jgi:hypothetical protein